MFDEEEALAEVNSEAAEAEGEQETVAEARNNSYTALSKT
jgi:hypothetical protein